MPTPRTSKKSPTKKKKTTAAKKAASKKAPASKAVKKATKKAVKKAPAKKAGAKKAATKKVAKKSAAKTAGKTAAKSKPTAEKKTTASTKAKPDTSAAAKPAAKKKLPKFLTDSAWLKGQRKMLIAERGKYIHNAEALAAEAHSLMADRDPGDVQFDEESGEGDTLAVERDRDLALSAKAREKVDEIDAALGRLDAGSYGVCISGEGDVVPKERLEFIPEAAKCVQHQTSMF